MRMRLNDGAFETLHTPFLSLSLSLYRFPFLRFLLFRFRLASDPPTQHDDVRIRKSTSSPSFSLVLRGKLRAVCNNVELNFPCRVHGDGKRDTLRESTALTNGSALTAWSLPLTVDARNARRGNGQRNNA
ncbi:hypothetical protein X777_10827 [Ooceraea biroi]|uniref:Uncharacterized protein n=1 Tax=Ooceraea biroi TaxID=2015173 RepID=A0A026W3Z6_OOCBI|nr:hypothetical protein X777_10827 [Ooceraea biroi]